MSYSVTFPVKTLKVAGYDFQLLIWNNHEANGANRYGECSSIEQVIRIRQDFATPFKAVDTLLHEIMHAIFWAYGVGEDDKEERMVAMFGTALMTLHRDNPWLAGWISETLAL